MVSVGQESERGLAECLWLKTSHEVVVKLLGKVLILSEVSVGGMVECGGRSSKLTHRFFSHQLGLFTGAAS